MISKKENISPHSLHDKETLSTSEADPVKSRFSRKTLIIFGIAGVVVCAALFGIIFYFLSPSVNLPSSTAEALNDSTTQKTIHQKTDPTTEPPKSTSNKPKVSSVSTINGKTDPTTDTPKSTSNKPKASSENTTQKIINGKTDSTTEPPKSNSSSNVPDKLVFVQLLFRHGARAPARLPREYKKYFPRGRGQLTDRGYNHSYLLGKFLKKRYVDTGFLDSRMNPKEMLWRSRQMQRCLSTAATVGAAMFRSASQKFVTVPIVSNHDGADWFMNIPMGCPLKDWVLKEQCPTLYDGGDDEATEAYKCLGGNHTFFQNRSLEECDVFINMVRNEITVPDIVKDNYEVISAEYLKVRNFMNGLDSPKLVRARFGFIVGNLLNSLKHSWGEYKNNKKIKKLHVYSTQDWILGGVLQGFGVLKHIQTVGPKEEPHYNTMIIMELWERNGKPYVKFLYKPEEVTSEDHKLMDLTSIIPNCGGMECPLEKFDNCCNNVRLAQNEIYKACNENV